ncbi:MalM family protein [Vibrio quintilis]|uniref:Maltose regulon periplasmic protein n=1 Tax=Vibrio quintilis TaxID=1117707 RepID=A0A1M7Z1B5_9VIBR|nr:MalM family protein [Vibrio quintilis]SHO58663.1 maltose regulon periplasmic protein [Vibrio quintilis]
MNKAFSTFLMGLTISGCSQGLPPENHADVRSLTQMPVCCSSYAGFYWTGLDKNDQVRLKLDQNSPVWSFPGGKSYFGAFRFSPQSGQVAVHIDSLMSAGQVFAPSVILLDAHFKPQITYDLNHFSIRYADAFGQNRYAGQFQINAENTPYMVVYTDADKTGDKVIIPHPARIRAMESGEPLPIVSDINYSRTHQGTLNIQVTTESVRQHPAPVISQPAPHQFTRTAERDSVRYYHHAIQRAVAANHIDKALALLEEAKVLNIPGARRVFIEAINKKTAR